MAEPLSALGDLVDFPHSTDAVRSSPGHAPVRPAEQVVPAVPTGTVTFLLTDIEGSTGTWEAHGERMGGAVARHYEILDAAITGHGGVRPIEQGEGDSLVAAFARASDAIAAALDAQRALTEEDWPDGAEISVRMALHTGEAQLRECFYVGTSIIRCARLRALAHGGQVLISNTTADLLADGLPEGAALLPLGAHRLRDLRQPERVFQLVHRALRAHFAPLRSLDALPNNLPAQLTSFVGRDLELVELRALMDDHRLVTLVGAGGCGKTRLAAQLAADLVDAYAGGVWWVELGPVSDPDLVPPTVMTALGLSDARGLDPLERITRYLAAQRVLVVLDNCEHVVGAVAPLLEGVLRACPNVVALGTSREPVGTPGEVAWRVPPLSLPLGGEQQSAEAMLSSEAVRLFVDRAVDARPTFRVDGANARTVAAICARVDGLPLAIELAAARVRALSPERILDGLADRFRLLTGGVRTAVARQQTLQASVEWSHDLLSDAERILLRRLAAFTGGFSLEAAETVTSGDPLERWEVLTLLSDLVDRSLVVFDGERYRLLQTIHDFAAGQLLGAGEADALRNRHAAHFVALAEAAAAELAAAPGAATLASLEADHDNLLGALRWVLASGDSQSALRLVGALAVFWKIRGHYSEALEWSRRVLASAPMEPSLVRARAVWGVGYLSKWSMDAPGGYGVAETEEASALARQLGDPALLARSAVDQGLMEMFMGLDEAATTIGRAVEAGREAGDAWTLGYALSGLAFLWIFGRDRYDRAWPILDELSGLSPSPYWQTWHRMCAGIAAWRQGRLADARAALEAALAQSHELGDPALESWCVGFALAAVLTDQGDYEAVRSVVGRSMAWQGRSAFARLEFVQSRLVLLALAEADLPEARRQLDAIDPAIRQCGIPVCMALCDVLNARLALEDGNLAAARSYHEAASAAATNLDSPWGVVEAHDLGGRLARAAGDPAAAEDLHHRALATAVEYGFRGTVAETLESLAALAAMGESHSEAARLFGAAQALRQALGQVRWPLHQPSHDAEIAALRARMGDEAFERAWSEGAALSLEEAAAYASRARGERKRPSAGWESLTPTEHKVVALAAQGLTNAEIGRRLFIAAGTARIHLSHIYAKVGVANRTELAATAIARSIADRVP